MSATIDHQIAELKREIALRKNVYPKWVSAAKMRQAEADLAIDRMTAALHTVMAVKRLRATMVEHRMLALLSECTCGLSFQNLDSRPVDETWTTWLDHVFERSRAAEHPTQEREAGNGS